MSKLKLRAFQRTALAQGSCNEKEMIHVGKGYRSLEGKGSKDAPLEPLRTQVQLPVEHHERGLRSPIFGIITGKIIRLVEKVGVVVGLVVLLLQ